MPGILEFVQQLSKDAALQRALEAEAHGLERAERLTAFVDFARMRGYEVKLEDAKRFLAELASSALGEQELERVAGGISDMTRTAGLSARGDVGRSDSLSFLHDYFWF